MDVRKLVVDLAENRGGMCLVKDEGILNDNQYEEIVKAVEEGLREYFFGSKEYYSPPRFYSLKAQRYWENTPGYLRYRETLRQIIQLSLIHI